MLISRTSSGRGSKRAVFTFRLPAGAARPVPLLVTPFLLPVVFFGFALLVALPTAVGVIMLPARTSSQCCSFAPPHSNSTTASQRDVHPGLLDAMRKHAPYVVCTLNLTALKGHGGLVLSRTHGPQGAIGVTLKIDADTGLLVHHHI
jgi:hypothetical protein